MFDPLFHHKQAKSMIFRPLGRTNIHVSHIGLGAASFGNIFGAMCQEEINELVLEAIKSGINFIDTAPWYGQGLSEKRLGLALKNIPRDKYFIASKVGRYGLDASNMFDFSRKTVEKGFFSSLKHLQVDYIDLVQVHDIEFAQSISQLIHHTLPALQKLKEKGLIRYIGITGYNLRLLKKVVHLSQPGVIDTVLSYARCNLINQDLLEDLEYFKKRGIGIINGSPLGLGLLNNEVNAPKWHLALPMTVKACKTAAKKCSEKNYSLAKIGIQYALMQDAAIATHLISMVNIQQLKENLSASSSVKNLDQNLLTELLTIFSDLPLTQWENFEVKKYWEKMEILKCTQNIDMYS